MFKRLKITGLQTKHQCTPLALNSVVIIN